MSALDEIAAERFAQVDRFGHAPERDAALPLDELPKKAREYVTIGIDRLHPFQGELNIPLARKKLVQAAALLIAAIERLPREDQAESPAS